MRRIRTMVTPLLLLVCLTLGMMNVSAADDRLGQVVDGSVLTDASEASWNVTFGDPMQRSAYLNGGSGHISIAGTRKVSVGGNTTALQTVDSLMVTLHLQRLSGNSWVTVQTLGPKWAYNAYSVSNSKTYSVSGGYYYRVYGGHTVNKGSTMETCTSYTDGIWVS